jgi:pyruvate,orthophosphate dikinase
LPPSSASRCEKLRQRVEELHEFNPMLGHRGCRLAISYPEIAEMQARAIFEAAVEAAKFDRRAGGAGNHGAAGRPSRELDFVKAAIDAVARLSSARKASTSLSGRHHDRTAAGGLRAHAIAESAQFFSFGTNDLTQTTFGISRDDASSFLMTYQQPWHDRKGPVRHA